MDHAKQVKHAARLLELRRSGGHELGAEPWRNPVDGYTRQDLLELEMERLFHGGPLLAGLSCEVRERGDYLTLDAAGLPVLVVRGADGVLRAMLNVCRHRGAPVVQGRGSLRDRIVCPYHGWTYDSAGKLVRWSFEPGFEGLDAAELGLTPLPVAEAHGLVYVRATPGEAIDTGEVFGGAEQELAPFDFARWQWVEERSNVRAMNWKLVVDTFMEAYHVPNLHRKSLAPLFEGQLALFDAFGDNGRLVAARRSIAELEDRPEAEWSLLPHATLLWFLFPNVVLIHQQDHVELWQVYPLDGSPDRSVAKIQLYAPQAVTGESMAAHLRKNMDLLMRVTNDEDFELGEQIQRGFHSAAQDSIVYGRNEPGLVHYHRSLRRRLGLAEGEDSRCT